MVASRNPIIQGAAPGPGVAASFLAGRTQAIQDRSAQIQQQAQLASTEIQRAQEGRAAAFEPQRVAASDAQTAASQANTAAIVDKTRFTKMFNFVSGIENKSHEEQTAALIARKAKLDAEGTDSTLTAEAIQLGPEERKAAFNQFKQAGVAIGHIKESTTDKAASQRETNRLKAESSAQTAALLDQNRREILQKTFDNTLSEIDIKANLESKKAFNASAGKSLEGDIGGLPKLLAAKRAIVRQQELIDEGVIVGPIAGTKFGQAFLKLFSSKSQEFDLLSSSVAVNSIRAALGAGIITDDDFNNFAKTLANPGLDADVASLALETQLQQITLYERSIREKQAFLKAGKGGGLIAYEPSDSLKSAYENYANNVKRIGSAAETGSFASVQEVQAPGVRDNATIDAEMAALQAEIDAQTGSTDAIQGPVLTPQPRRN